MKKSFGEILIRLVEIVAEVYLKTKSEDPFSYETDGTKKKIIVPNAKGIVITVVGLIYLIATLQK